MDEKPKHADHIDDEQEKRRRKWAEFITKNPDAFYAALKGVSVAAHRAEIDESLKKDFAPEALTPEDEERLKSIEEKMQDKDKEKEDPEKKSTGKIILPLSQREGKDREEGEKKSRARSLAMQKQGKDHDKER